MNEAIQRNILVKSWQRAIIAMTLSLILLLVIYHETLFLIVSIWLRSGTFTHCFLIFPISGYLIWRRKNRLEMMIPTNSYVGLLLLAFLGFTWLLGDLADVSFVQQFSFVAMIPAVVWSFLGTRIVKEIIFPLFFLIFSVPFGEFLTPTLINFTADFTVAMVSLTGIPIYREGTFFSLPSGDWSVVEACSGLRYLIASITLGTLFAYINYYSTLRRVCFIFAASFVPIIANGFRAFMIVMIGHFSGMTLAVGVDHLIYGWVFFGLVMALLFWIGSFWSEQERDLEFMTHIESQEQQSLNFSNPYPMMLFVFGFTCIWPIWTNAIQTKTLEHKNVSMLSIPEPVSPWVLTDPMTSWEPMYLGATSEKKIFYKNGQYTVALFIKYYQTQEQDKELVNSENVLLPRTHPTWKLTSEIGGIAKLNGTESTVSEGRLLSTQQELLAWRWYWIGGRHTANDYFAKLLEAKDKLLGHSGEEAAIILAVGTNSGDVSTGRLALQQFVDDMLPSIEKSLTQASAESR